MTKCELCEREADSYAGLARCNGATADVCVEHYVSYRDRLPFQRMSARERVDAQLAARGSGNAIATVQAIQERRIRHQDEAFRLFTEEAQRSAMRNLQNAVFQRAYPGEFIEEARAEHREIVETSLTPCSECRAPLRRDQDDGSSKCAYCVRRGSDTRAMLKTPGYPGKGAPLDKRIALAVPAPNNERHPSDWDVFSTPTWES